MSPAIERALNANFWKYTLLLVANKRVFVAILGVYYLSIPGVTEVTIGLIILVGSLAGFILEIPSGYLSDKMGLKNALIVARFLMLGSTVGFLVADSLWWLIVASIFLSASNAFQSGTGSAFIHETLKALGRDNEYTRLAGKMSSIGFAVPIVFMVLTPFLVSISIKAPFLVALVIDLIGLVAVLLLTKPPVTPTEIEEISATNFRSIVKEGIRYKLFPIAVFSGIVGGVLFALGIYRAPYQELLAVPVIYFGIFFGLGRALASIILANSGNIRDRFNRNQIFAFQIMIYAILMGALVVTAKPWVVVLAFILANGFQWGLSKIDQGFQLDLIGKSKFKATLLSVRAQIDIMFSGVLSAGFGLLVGYFSYQTGFFILLIIFFVTILPLYWYQHRYVTV